MEASSDMFVQRARERVETLGRDISQLEKQEEGVRRRVRELREQMDHWQRAIDLYAEAMDIPLAEPAPGQLMGFLDPNEATVPELVAHYMSERGRRARISEIADWLVSIGRFPEDAGKTNQNYGQVYTAMLRHPKRFVKEAPGTFRLSAET